MRRFSQVIDYAKLLQKAVNRVAVANWLTTAKPFELICWSVFEGECERQNEKWKHAICAIKENAECYIIQNSGTGYELPLRTRTCFNYVYEANYVDKLSIKNFK